MNEATVELSTAEWWGRKRIEYNIWLALAGILAFFIYVTLYHFMIRKTDSEITLINLGFDIMVYLIVMLIANIGYFFGPLSEIIIKPYDIPSFRNTAYNIGLLLSIAFPFSVPGCMAYLIAHQIAYQHPIFFVL